MLSLQSTLFIDTEYYTFLFWYLSRNYNWYWSRRRGENCPRFVSPITNVTNIFLGEQAQSLEPCAGLKWHLVDLYNWGMLHHKQVSRSRDNELHPTASVWCNYLSLPSIPISGAILLMCALRKRIEAWTKRTICRHFKGISLKKKILYFATNFNEVFF